MAAAAAFAEVNQCLQSIGFTDVQHRNSIIAEGGFNSLNDFFEVKIGTADAFKEALQVSAQRALLRKNDSDQVDTISKAADVEI